ncbi:MAG: PAS domain S-box protein [Thermoflexales bacterium]|nr:PAS domain S-box protein [Thermoflexales bacterium]
MSDVRILVVEDERIVAKDIQLRLHELGYRVAGVVASGEQAIQQAAELRPDLVLMDILLKGELDGIQAAEQIQARFGIPVMYLTSHSDEATLQRAKLTSPLGYILKPFESRELHTAIEIALYRHAIEGKIRELNESLERRVVERTAQLAAANGALQQSEAKFRHIYENAPVMICSLDEHDCIVDVNRKWLEETGYSRDEVVGRRHDFLMTPESSERAFCTMAPQFERDGFVRDVPYQYIQKSGTVIEVLFDCQASTDPAGRRIGLAVVRNVTEHRWAERRLRLQSAALEAAANAIVITNAHGRIVWANPAFSSLSGYGLEEVVNQTMRVLNSGQQDEAFYRQLWETIKAGRVWHGELVNRRKDGSLYVEEQTITPVRDDYGEIAHFVAIKNLKRET